MSDVFSNFDLVLRAFLLTVELAVVSAVASLVLGTLLAAARVGPIGVLSKAGALYVSIFRNTPLLVIFIFVFNAVPKLDVPQLSFFTKGCIALTVYTAAFVCEVIRSGVNTVPVGQAEASRALGFTFGMTLSEVILPQAVRSVVPPLTNVMIALLKNTTIAAGFSVAEAGGIYQNLSERGYDVLIGLLWVAVGFLILVIPLTLLQRGLERRWSVAR